jgi:hypothetical protein
VSPFQGDHLLPFIPRGDAPGYGVAGLQPVLFLKKLDLGIDDIKESVYDIKKHINNIFICRTEIA